MAEVTEVETKAKPKMGCGTFLAILIVCFILVGLGINQAAGYYFTHCADRDVFDCFLHPIEKPEAVGVIAKGTYTYKDYSAEFILHIPPDGGEVTGEVTGTCTATVTGTYDGADKGVITGRMSGFCDPFIAKIPAKGSFFGSVEKVSKKVPLHVEGSGAGFEKSDTMTLTF